MTSVMKNLKTQRWNILERNCETHTGQNAPFLRSETFKHLVNKPRRS